VLTLARRWPRLGGLSVPVNNRRRQQQPERSVRSTRSLEQVLRSASPASRTAAPLSRTFAAGHGSIVNVSSRQAERASAGLAPYVASKGGLNALTRALAVEYGRQGIRCNALSVGYVLNERRDANLPAERRAELEAMHLTRLGRPDDVAYAVVYLASRESEFVTGALLAVDGGNDRARSRPGREV
jgi:NAD(P)-dependent dehydrogenase (short-subunit alcohol dehydrogenase family)